MNQTEQMAKLRALITESVEVAPVDQPAAGNGDASNELEALMKKYGVIEEGGCNMTAEGEACPVHGLEECGSMEEEIKPAGISDELAAKKIAAKIMGTPNLNIPKIKQYVTKYLSMVGKSPTDVDHLAALVSTELEHKGMEESSEINEAYINSADDAIKLLGNLRAIGKKIELGQAAHEGNLAGEYANDVWDVYSWLENKVDKNDPKFKSVMDPVMALRGKAKGMEREPGSGKNAQFGNEIVNTLYPLMQWIEANLKNKVNEASLSDEAAAQKIADKIKGTPNLTVPTIKQYVKKYLGMVGKNPSDVDFLAAHVHDILSGKGLAEAKKNKKPDADGDGIPDWADKNPKKKGGDEDRKDESVEESINITVDGAEAEMFINRMAELAGTGAHVGPDVQADMCGGCGCSMDQCTCDDGSCVDCGCADCECDTPHAMPMENADHDHGHDHHSSEGEPINPDDYIWQGRYAPGTQSFVKGGDNPLIKEDANLLFSKLRKEYKDYIAEAELARSNAGDASPLTANNRDEFDKDPFASDEPVTDGTHSPLSTIKRQHVAK